MADEMHVGTPTDGGSEATLILNISGEQKILQLTKQVTELETELDEATAKTERLDEALKRANQRVADAEAATGLQKMRDELTRFKSLAEQSVQEFKSFLMTANLNDVAGSNDWKFEDYFDSLRRGCMTTSEAITTVKSNFQGLIEENWSRSGGIFDTHDLSEFVAKLNTISDRLNDVAVKVDSLSTSGGGAGASGAIAGGIGDLPELFDKISSASASMGSNSQEAYEPVINLVKAITEYASVDVDKIYGISQAFANIAAVGAGTYNTKSIENIVLLATKLRSLSEQGYSQIRFDFKGLNDLHVRKASLEHVANYLPTIASVNAENLKAIADINWSNINNIKVSKGTLESINRFTQAVLELEEAQSRINVVTPTVESGSLKAESEQFKEVTAESEAHVDSMEKAANAEERKANVSDKVVAGLKTEEAAMGKATAETEHHVDVMAELEKEVVDLPTNLEKIRAALRREGVDSTYAEKIAEDFGSLEGKIDKVTVGAQVFGDNVRRVTGVAITEVNNLGDTIKKVLDYEYQLNDEGGYNLTATHMADTSTINYGKHEKLAVADAAKKEEEAFESAKRAVLAYSSAMKTYVSVKGDIVRSGDVFSAQNQSLQGTANILTQTTAVYRELTSAENLNNLSEEHKIEISRRVKKAEEDLTIALEKRENKEKSSSNKQAEIDSYNNAVNAITRYYKALTEVSQAGNNVMFDGNKWVSLSSDYDELANKLNSTKAAFEGVTDAMDKGKFSEEQYAKLTEKIQDGIVNQRLAEGRAAKQTAREVEQAAKEKYDAEKNCTTALTEGEAILRNYSAAENSRNESSRNAYRNLKESTEELRRAQSTYDGTTKGAEKLEAATRKYNLTLKESKRVIVANGDSVRSFGDKLKSAFKTLSMYFSMSRIIMSVYREIRKMISTSIELDQTMTQLRIVTKASNDEMQRFGETAAASAKRIGASITDLTSSATTFARLGYTMDESSLLAEYTTMLQNVGNIDVSDAQNAVTAIVKAFSDEIDINNIETVMDRLVVVGENIAQRRSNTSKEIGYIGQRRVGFIVQTEERLSA